MTMLPPPGPKEGTLRPTAATVRPPASPPPRPRRVLSVAALGVLLAVGFVGARTATLPSRQPTPRPLADAPVDAAAAAEHLAGALRCKTISAPPSEARPEAELARLHEHLRASFPLVHERLVLEKINDFGLLYTWKGSDAAAPPYVLLSHQDVVPIEESTAGDWTHPPFDGVVADGFVWGRGALDDKVGVVAILESVEALLREGFQPRRTVVLAFGHDEEQAGVEGAGGLASALVERGVHAEFVLDEGGPITMGVVPGVRAPVAVVGVSEKGYVTVELTATTPGGHSSTPPRDTAVSVLARAVERVQGSPMPASVERGVGKFADFIAPEMAFGYRLVFSNRTLFGPLLGAVLSGGQATNATIRTTTAATVFQAGVKDNVLPATARALVNFRIVPGDTSAAVLAHVNRVIEDPRVVARPLPETLNEPSPVSSTDSRAFARIAQTVRDVFPDTLVAPSTFIGATDGRLYTRVAPDTYRFLPVPLTSQDIGRIHGKDERIAVADLANAVRFYRQLMRASDAE